jgi:inhibitor of cysteine peptidase
MRTRAIAGAVVAVLLGVVIGLGAAGCSESRAMVGPEDSGTSVRVGIGQVLEVSLESNPSTGYSWQVVEVPEFLTQTGEPEFQTEASGDVVGAGGTETLRFTADGSGTGTLRLEYRRPWESDTPAREVYELEVTAR